MSWSHLDLGPKDVAHIPGLHNTGRRHLHQYR